MASCADKATKAIKQDIFTLLQRVSLPTVTPDLVYMIPDSGIMVLSVFGKF